MKFRNLKNKFKVDTSAFCHLPSALQSASLVKGSTLLILGSFCLLSTENVRANIESIDDNKIVQIAPEKEAEQLYRNGRYPEAIAVLNRVILDAKNEGDFLKKVLAERNLALIYLKQGQWQAAENTIASANLDLGKINNTSQREKATAKLLEVNGQLQFSQGEFERALSNWQAAAQKYQTLEDDDNYLKNLINKVRALQNLGLYSRAIKIVTKIEENLDEKPNNIFKHQTLLTIGSLLQGKGRLQESEAILQRSLTVANELNSPDASARSFINLGNTSRLQGQLVEALNLYQLAIEATANTQIELEAKLNQLNLLVATEQIEEATTLIPQIEADLNQLPRDRETIYAKINLGQNTIEIDKQKSETILNEAIADAEKLGDRKGLSYALGTLGNLYETQQNWQKARELTEKALFVAGGINAPEVAYQWQWQLGRIFKEKQNKKEAILAYSQATENLQFLRRDLIENSSQIRFNFRESVEPVYRELADLLLQPNATQAELQLARETIEALQLAELDNFFRDACLDTNPVDIDRVDRTAAIFYTIILDDRLEVILALPEKPLTRYATDKTQLQLEKTIDELRFALNEPNSTDVQTLSNIVYNWLIASVETDLAANNIQNLVFVMDGALRNVTLAALYDGEQYLIEKYAVAFAPSLQLIDDRSSRDIRERILLAGLSEARQDFPALPGVKEELDRIETKLPSRVLLNDDFTQINFANSLERSPYSIVHVASHGEFSSQLEDTFILTWNDRINIEELNILLRSDSKQTNPIDLLVLSACQTAVGDDRAAIGLAGMAVRAGARSTIASLWAVSDESTTLLMTYFYEEWTNNNLTKAEALRRAQQRVLQEERFSHPYFWSAFILLGNWL